jgi:hypothetical protein
MRHALTTLFCLSVAAIVLTPVIGQTDAPDGKWLKLTRSGITVEYQADTADLAQQFIPEAAARKEKRAPIAGTSELRTLVNHQNELLRFIAGQLGMGKPSKDMTEVFQQLPSTMRVLQSISKCRHFKLWRADELKKWLRSGHKDPWITYVPATGDFVFGRNLTHWEREPNVQAIPIIVDQKSTDSPLSQAVVQLDACQKIPGSIPAAGVVCHEVAEITMLYDLHIRGAFRRWFCDGAANCIAAECLEKFLGKDASAAYLATLDTKDYEDIEDEVDLLHWRAVEWESETPFRMDERLQNAHYAYATAEIRALTSKYGPEVLPGIFKEIARSRNTDDSILDAIKKTTGEDYRRRLAQYGAKSNDPLKGLAISDFRVGTGERTGERQWRMTQETTNIPLTNDDRHGILVTFRCATAETPVQVRCVCTTPRKPDGGMGTETCTFGSKSNECPIRAWFTFDEEHFVPGSADVKIYLNDKLIMDVEFKLIDTRSPSPAVPQAVVLKQRR